MFLITFEFLLLLVVGKKGHTFQYVPTVNALVDFSAFTRFLLLFPELLGTARGLPAPQYLATRW